MLENINLSREAAKFLIDHNFYLCNSEDWMLFAAEMFAFAFPLQIKYNRSCFME